MDQVQLPLLCSKCLGQSANLTLVRDLKGEPCRLCTRPFATFSWRKHPNGPRELSRFCVSCSERKNVCQSCYRNFSTGLPLAVHESASGLIVNAAPQALKYAAVKAEADKAAETSRNEYQERLSSQQSQLAIENANSNIVSEIRTTLLSNTIEGPENESGTFLVANIGPEANIKSVEARLTALGGLKSLQVYPQARCGFATFGSRQDAVDAVKNLIKGIILVDGIKLKLIWCSPMEILDSEKQIGVLIQQFMRGQLK